MQQIHPDILPAFKLCNLGFKQSEIHEHISCPIRTNDFSGQERLNTTL